jgi:hypothetical protein
MNEIHTTLIARQRAMLGRAKTEAERVRRGKIIEDVRSRKGTIISGGGTVHGDAYRVEVWAL